MLYILDELYLAQGAERKCYIHPKDNNKILKIEYNNKIKRNQNKLDIFYYNYLNQKNVSYSCISKCYGTVETNKGNAVVFEFIKNYNDLTPHTFEEIIKNKILTDKEELQLLNELQDYLTTNNILFGDVVLSNVLCKESFSQVVLCKESFRTTCIYGRNLATGFWYHPSIILRPVCMRKKQASHSRNTN